MAKIRIPSFISSYADGNTSVTIQGKTVGDILDNLIIQYPPLRNHLFNGDTLRSFINIYVGEDDIRSLQGLETAVLEDAHIMIIPSIAGG